MSALPNRTPHGPRKNCTATELLVATLRDQASAGEQIRLRDSRIAQARLHDAAELPYPWQTNDGREAELRVYYQPGEEAEVVATQLLCIDFRSPTTLERVRYEDEFDAELAQSGELSRDLASRIWERMQG